MLTEETYFLYYLYMSGEMLLINFLLLDNFIKLIFNKAFIINFIVNQKQAI